MSRAIPVHTINLNAARGMSLMTIAMLIVPAMDAIAKLLGSEMSPWQVAWGRFFFQALLLTPIVLTVGGGLAALRTRCYFLPR